MEILGVVASAHVSEEGGGAYAASAVHFDGNQVVVHDGNFGVTTFNTLLFSGWFKMAAAGSTLVETLPDGQMSMAFTETQITFDGYDAGFNGDSVYGDIDPGEWTHILLAYDRTDDNKCKVYVDGADATDTVLTFNTGGVALASEDLITLFNAIGQPGFEGDVADLYMAFGQWLDLTNAANVAKFIADGKPVSLGADGSTPTGSAPTVFLTGNAATFGTNAGTGGTVTTAYYQSGTVAGAGPGAVPLTNAPLGAAVVAVWNDNEFADVTHDFEATISVEDQIQQTGATDYSSDTIIVTIAGALTNAGTSPSD